MISTRRWGAALLGLCATFAYAQTDLLGAARAALAHDPVYAAAVAQSQADATKRRQGRAGYLPQISATAGLGYGDINQQTSGARFSGPGFGSNEGIGFDTSSAGASDANWALTIRENLYSSAKTATAQQMNAAADAGPVSLQLARQTLLLQVAQAYFDVLLAQDNLAALKAEHDTAVRAHAIAQARFEAGDAAITDASDAQARADLAGAQMIEAQTELDLKRAALRDLTGEPDTALQPLTDSAGLAAIQAGDFADWQKRALQTSPLIRLSNLGVSAAQAESTRYRADGGTTVDAFASYLGQRVNGAGYGGTGGMHSNSAVVGIMVTIPIYSGGMRSAKRDESLALLNKAEMDQDAARVRVARQIRQAYLGLRSAQVRVTALTQAVHSARLQLDANQTGFEAGDRPSIDVLNARSALSNTQRDLAAARYQVAMERLRLSAAAGELDDREMAQINALLH
ncbi:porin [Pandoraea thiooxydans]|uniref:Porin n=1 Tax=Pandoraea thiooxydans TaxID=445709 RepID=A0A0G3ELZ1_9BURK|nr:TolC family outer membrane protein [Pandoraea thiooxydans]AKJ68073.1 porin [Pandoraea thiooxydans]APR95328.1 porin [Pandoraea thiooxydans]